MLQERLDNLHEAASVLEEVQTILLQWLIKERERDPLFPSRAYIFPAFPTVGIFVAFDIGSCRSSVEMFVSWWPSVTVVLRSL